MINDIQVTITGDEISNEELSIYLTQMQSKQKRKMIKANVTVDNEYIDVKYTLEDVPFERIRRITGYLVGATSRWNNAKQSELHDRTCHGVGN